MRQTLKELKGDIFKSTIIWYFNTVTDRTTSQKISKDMGELNNTVYQQDIIDI